MQYMQASDGVVGVPPR